MRKTEYKRKQLYDDGFKWIINNAKQKMQEKDDDFLIMCAGTRGTGKSSLMLHAYELLKGEQATVDRIGLNPSDFARAIYKSKDDDFPRFCGNDEANISKREAMGKYNKDIIDLYFSIRGLKIFHWWNNPSLDILDREIINELIKGFIYIATKDVDRPRVYYYFTKDDLVKLYEDKGDLLLKTLDENAREYAYYKGWFRPYKGRLWESYLDKKEDRMHEKIDDFYKKYGVAKHSMSAVARKINVSHPTVKKYIEELKKSKDYSFREGVHYLDSPTGYKVTDEGAGVIEEYAYNK